MNTKTFVISTVALTAMLTSCSAGGEKEEQSLAEISKQELATALNERDQLLGLVNDVSAGLEQIKQLENIMSVSTERSGDDNAARRAMILADIAKLKETVGQRRQQLEELESRLQNSTINNKNLKETIDALRVQIDSQMEEIESLGRQLLAANEHIGVLNNAVDSLNSTVSTVTGERNAAQESSLKLENELNTCYYVVATKSELKAHRIIESGFLRKTRLMEGDFDKGYFTVGDKRLLDTLPLNASKVKILTNHPETSYVIVDNNGEKVLRITDSEQFWSLTNFLVVRKN